MVYRAATHHATQLQEWFNDIGLKMAPQKCHVMHVSRRRKNVHLEVKMGDQAIGRVNKLRLLGLHVDDKLSMQRQVEICSARANYMLSLVKRIVFKFAPGIRNKVVKLLVQALVVSRITWTLGFIDTSNMALHTS
eukprot:TRINITY_DN66938_c1_g1_i1.p2 TRINITY_DN66938_c1_g1~~TRINITY_DN66938_c1_g1_i1.p2  ORF type:complete len:135 (-),score=57.68 TRINITY_DN66938_c1_g1_i1:886-1290(-)